VGLFASQILSSESKVMDVGWPKPLVIWVCIYLLVDLVVIYILKGTQIQSSVHRKLDSPSILLIPVMVRCKYRSSSVGLIIYCT
jgi:hypothetical protein